MINIVRDPRWGRNLETAGEDPLLSGEYAVNWVKGFQTAKESPYPLQASSCCKHFVANELDGWNNTDRDHIDVFVPQQDLADRCVPPAPFRATHDFFCRRSPHVASRRPAYPRARAQLPPELPGVRRGGQSKRHHVLV